MDHSLAQYLDQFTKQEKSILVAATKRHIPGMGEFHLGMLPLLSITNARIAIAMWRVEHDPAFKSHLLTALHHKLTTMSPGMIDRNNVSFLLWLNPQKVMKVLGNNPRRGVAFKAPLKKVTVGMKWSLPKRDYVPDTDVLVKPMMKVIPNSNGSYTITVDKKYHQAAMDYLVDNCM